jgi:ribosomal-protein-alanine N-acetyltransferase
LKDTVLKTKRLRLEPPNDEYASDIHQYSNEPQFCRYIDSEPTESVEDAAVYLNGLRTDNAASRRRYWVVVENHTQKAVGTLGLIFPFAARHKVAEFGYGFSPSVWGSGYFQEAAKAVFKIAFDEMGLVRIQAIARVDNVAAIRSTQKLGFQNEALLQSFYQSGGNRVDAVVMALFQSE